MSSHKSRYSEGKQPARVDVARTRSTIGDTASENWPIDLKELGALESLDNWRLGDLHGEILGAQVHHGVELKKCQDALFWYRGHRGHARKELARTLASESEVDATLARDQGYQAFHRFELLARTKARRLNEMLGQLMVARDMVEEEMTRRIRARGFGSPLPGHVHLFNVETAKYQRQRRARARFRRLRRNRRSRT